MLPKSLEPSNSAPKRTHRPKKSWVLGTLPGVRLPPGAAFRKPALGSVRALLGFQAFLRSEGVWALMVCGFWAV